MKFVYFTLRGLKLKKIKVMLFIHVSNEDFEPQQNLSFLPVVFCWWLALQCHSNSCRSLSVVYWSLWLPGPPCPHSLTNPLRLCAMTADVFLARPTLFLLSNFRFLRKERNQSQMTSSKIASLYDFAAAIRTFTGDHLTYKITLCLKKRGPLPFHAHTRTHTQKKGPKWKQEWWRNSQRTGDHNPHGLDAAWSTVAWIWNLISTALWNSQIGSLSLLYL